MTPQHFTTLRRRLGLTQAQLAMELGLTANTIARYEMPSNQGRFPIPALVARVVRGLAQATKQEERL